MDRVNLTLSGGGSRCLFQLGIIDFLEEDLKVEIDSISGVSASSIIGALHCSGYSAKESLEILKEIDFREIVKFNYSLKSLFKFNRAKETLKRYIRYRKLEDLPKKLYITVVDIRAGESKTLDSGSLSDLILASCSLYPLFYPYRYLDSDYVDGGFKNNLPVEPFLNSNLPNIAINVNPLNPINPRKFRLFKSLKRTIMLLFYANIEVRAKMANLFLESSEIGRYSILDLKNFDKMFQLGREFAKSKEKLIAKPL